MKRTTVSIDEETKKQLAKLGGKGESFDAILQRVMSKTNSLCTRAEKTPEEEDQE